MSAFRGGRLLSAVGYHSLRCNRLHQRRIVSLGLTSLCQVNMKKRALLDVNSLPVNKFDLSNVGVLSPALSTLFSTEAVVSADGDLVEVLDEDVEAVICTKQVDKWPSPLKQHYQPKNTEVYFCGKGMNYNETFLKELFSQFGEVQEIRIPNKLKYEYYDRNNYEKDSYRYGFVLFKNKADVKKAIRAKVITGSDFEIEIFTKTNLQRKKPTFFINHLPEHITIYEINDYFKKFGQLIMINCFLSKFQTKANSNFAYIMFREDSVNSKSLIDVKHIIGDSNISIKNVDRYRSPYHSERKGKMVYISGINDGTTKDEITSHFSNFGKVLDVTIYDQGRVGLGVVNFLEKESAISAESVRWHEIGLSNIKAQILCMLNDEKDHEI